MASKAYTLNYFIDFFRSIPDHQWAEGTEQNGSTVQHCALGHASRRKGTTLDRTTRSCSARVNALENFLGNATADINDSSPGDTFSVLGKTPRGRILKALRNRKRYGNVLGKNADID